MVAWRRYHGICMFLVVLILLLGNTFHWFNVDWISIALLVIILVMPYAGYVKRISYGEATIDLEKDVEQFSSDVAKLKKDEKESKEYQQSETLIETLEKKDPELACMKLRMMLEMITRDVYERAFGKDAQKQPVSRVVQQLYDKKVIDRSLNDFTREFIYYTNQVAHGETLTQDIYADLIDAGLVLLDAYYDVIDEVDETKKK